MDHKDVPWMVSQEWLGLLYHNYQVYVGSPQQSEQQKNHDNFLWSNNDTTA